MAEGGDPAFDPVRCFEALLFDVYYPGNEPDAV